jgi:hypothetical protein
VAAQAVKVAEDGTPQSQFEALSRIAAEVRVEALRRAGVGAIEELLRLNDLHERVMRFGVLRQLARLPETVRPIAATTLAEELRQGAEATMTASGQFPPAIGKLLRPLQKSCTDTATLLSMATPGPSAETSDKWPDPPTPLETVVARTIQVASAESALARAAASAELASALAVVGTVLAVAGQPDDAARVGEAIDAVLAYGVAANLEQTELTDPTGARSQEVASVRSQAERATEVLEQHLPNAPPAVRDGLERAIQAAEPGREKAAGKKPGKGQGAGPPGKKGDHPGEDVNRQSPDVRFDEMPFHQ